MARRRAQEVVDLPAKVGNRKLDYERAVALARENPGRPVKVLDLDGNEIEMSQAITVRIRAGEYPIIDPEEFDVTTRQGPSRRKGYGFVYIGTKGTFR